MVSTVKRHTYVASRFGFGEGTARGAPCFLTPWALRRVRTAGARSKSGTKIPSKSHGKAGRSAAPPAPVLGALSCGRGPLHLQALMLTELPCRHACLAFAQTWRPCWRPFKAPVSCLSAPGCPCAGATKSTNRAKCWPSSPRRTTPPVRGAPLFARGRAAAERSADFGAGSVETVPDNVPFVQFTTSTISTLTSAWMSG